MKRHQQLPEWVVLLYLLAIIGAAGYVLYLALSSVLEARK